MNTVQDKDHIQMCQIGSWAFYISFKNIIWWIVFARLCSQLMELSGRVGSAKAGHGHFQRLDLTRFFLDFSTFLLILFLQQQQQIVLVQENVVIYWFLQLSSCFIQLAEASPSSQCVIWIIINFLPGKWFQYFSHFGGHPISKRSSQTYKSACPCPFW